MKRVLLVEDDEIWIMMIRKILEQEGFTLSKPAKSYREALDRFEEFDPSLAILDIEILGEKTGIDVAGRIRNFSDVPIIFFSSANLRREASAIKNTYYIDKNSGLTSLKNTVNTLYSGLWSRSA